MNVDLTIFKDYDIRGIYPKQLNGQVAKTIGYAIIRMFHPKTVAICRDMRLSGEEIRDGLANAFTSSGIDVFDAGLTGTEIAYFISGSMNYDMVIMISASHNPPEYNGLKIVLRGPVAVSGDNGLNDIKERIHKGPLPPARKMGSLRSIDVFPKWREKVLSLVDLSTFKPLTVVVDAGNGMAGKLVPLIFKDLPFRVVPLYFDLDGRFPHHIPNPLVEANNKDLIATMKRVNADVGLTFDGDADRVFFIDDTLRFVSGTLVTALLSRHILEKHHGELVLYNAICGRIVPRIIKKYGGKSERVRVGHSFIKNYMRKYHAIFAGEHSGHYYHRDYFNSESGVLTALLVLSLISVDGRKFSQIVDEVNVYPASGEINFAAHDIPHVMDAIKKQYNDAVSIDELDGVSVWYKKYWFNVRASKTEPLLRLNVEADTNAILAEKTKELTALIQKLGGSIT